MIKYHVFYAELMCLCELISRLNRSKVSWILSYVENFLNIICDFLLMGALFMHILHGKKIEQPIEKLSESFLYLSLNWVAVCELKNGEWQRHWKNIHRLITYSSYLFQLQETKSWKSSLTGKTKNTGLMLHST